MQLLKSFVSLAILVISSANAGLIISSPVTGTTATPGSLINVLVENTDESTYTNAAVTLAGPMGGYTTTVIVGSTTPLLLPSGVTGGQITISARNGVDSAAPVYVNVVPNYAPGYGYGAGCGSPCASPCDSPCGGARRSRYARRSCAAPCDSPCGLAVGTTPYGYPVNAGNGQIGYGTVADCVFQNGAACNGPVNDPFVDCNAPCPRVSRCSRRLYGSEASEITEFPQQA